MKKKFDGVKNSRQTISLNYILTENIDSHLNFNVDSKIAKIKNKTHLINKKINNNPDGEFIDEFN
ncbi:hypothetical protein AMR42_06975 [Limnothrix sp. PR1529]|nr:hypothetical protein BCR12_06645 [Limnothrix sp. P13C2]PIB14230.1 hypothetical protein AMR42_06975 [Limnothrix sp. PR1529]